MQNGTLFQIKQQFQHLLSQDSKEHILWVRIGSKAPVSLLLFLGLRTSLDIATGSHDCW